MVKVIAQIADELITLKTQRDQLDLAYTAKRDEMYNRLGGQPSSIYEHGGYKFQKTDQVTVLTMNKQKLIESLFNAGLTDQVREQIISDTLSESVRPPGIRITKINA